LNKIKFITHLTRVLIIKSTYVYIICIYTLIYDWNTTILFGESQKNKLIFYKKGLEFIYIYHILYGLVVINMFTICLS